MLHLKLNLQHQLYFKLNQVLDLSTLIKLKLSKYLQINLYNMTLNQILNFKLMLVVLILKIQILSKFGKNKGQSKIQSQQIKSRIKQNIQQDVQSHLQFHDSKLWNQSKIFTSFIKPKTEKDDQIKYYQDQYENLNIKNQKKNRITNLIRIIQKMQLKFSLIIENNNLNLFQLSFAVSIALIVGYLIRK
ncbi:unnamed protein product [Paramecium sonneborni]|uniref:Transmembrane protein n=1 Tax=Paramecium sonneborni TaxID=65129 RepID=A0A8S1R7L9_9CILI|nr:unnamed protein product [Paramecium sonneborni]